MTNAPRDELWSRVCTDYLYGWPSAWTFESPGDRPQGPLGKRTYSKPSARSEVVRHRRRRGPPLSVEFIDRTLKDYADGMMESICQSKGLQTGRIANRTRVREG